MNDEQKMIFGNATFAPLPQSIETEEPELKKHETRFTEGNVIVVRRGQTKRKRSIILEVRKSWPNSKDPYLLVRLHPPHMPGSAPWGDYIYDSDIPEIIGKITDSDIWDKIEQKKKSPKA